MDWTNERWVKVYTRDTGTWVLLCWQARCILPLLLRKLEPDGTIALGKHPAQKVVSKLLDIPIEVVEAGLTDLEDSGTVVIDGDVLGVPGFEDAQRSRTSGAQRQRDYREREHKGVTRSDDQKRGERIEEIRGEREEETDGRLVTPGHRKIQDQAKIARAWNAIAGRDPTPLQLEDADECAQDRGSLGEVVSVIAAIAAASPSQRPKNMRSIWWGKYWEETKEKWLPEEAKPKRQLTPEEEAAEAATLERYARANPEYYPDHPVNREATDAD